MDINTFSKSLIDFSPFKFEGCDDIYVFKNEHLFVNEQDFGKYVINLKNDNLHIELVKNFPFQTNVKICFDKDNFALVNVDKDALKLYPGNFRHPLAIDGFLIFNTIHV